MHEDREPELRVVSNDILRLRQHGGEVALNRVYDNETAEAAVQAKHSGSGAYNSPPASKGQAKGGKPISSASSGPPPSTKQKGYTKGGKSSSSASSGASSQVLNKARPSGKGGKGFPR